MAGGVAGGGADGTDCGTRGGRVVVFPESLYSYSEPDQVMTEEGPRTANGGKRGIRTELLHARERSETVTASVVAGDFFGPRVRTADAGERMVPAILAGKKLSVMGSAQPHSFTYVPDLAAARIRAAQTPELWNKVSTDIRELAEMLYQFEKPFIMDSAASESALGLRPTPLPMAAAATVAWWRSRA